MEEENPEVFWFDCNDPVDLLKSLHPPHTLGSLQPQSRQSRLYLLACARRLWHRLPIVVRELILLAEMVTDSPRKEEPLRAAVAPIAASLMQSPGEPEDCAAAKTELLATHFNSWNELEGNANKTAPPDSPLTEEEWRGFGGLVYLPFETNTPSYHWVSRKHHSVEVLREVYGNPYRHIHFRQTWRTKDVTDLAWAMYSHGHFSAMPALVDALIEAGCNNRAILSHCRSSVAHVRGCWVLDQLLKLR
jgi:hypothetical protein